MLPTLCCSSATKTLFCHELSLQLCNKSWNDPSAFGMASKLSTHLANLGNAFSAALSRSLPSQGTAQDAAVLRITFFFRMLLARAVPGKAEPGCPGAPSAEGRAGGRAVRRSVRLGCHQGASPGAGDRKVLLRVSLKYRYGPGYKLRTVPARGETINKAISSVITASLSANHLSKIFFWKRYSLPLGLDCEFNGSRTNNIPP